MVNQNLYETELEKLEELNKKVMITLLLLNDAKACLNLLRLLKSKLKQKNYSEDEMKRLLSQYEEEEKLTVEQIDRFEKVYQNFLNEMKQQTVIVSKLKTS